MALPMNTAQRPGLSEYEIHVWRFPLIAARQEITSLRHWLSDDELSIASRICSHAERDKRVVAWGRLRFILSRYLHCAAEEIEIVRSRFGRPEIATPAHAGIQFNLSHSGSLGLVAVSRHAVGIDIERIDGGVPVDRLAQRFFTPGEADRLQRQHEGQRIEAFYRTWVLKEAHLKAHGARVPSGLSQCEILLEGDGARLSRSDFESPVGNVLIEIPVSKGYCAAVAALQQQADISVLDL